MSVLYTVCGRGAGSARSDSRLRGNDVMGACMEAEAREMNGAVVCRTSPNIHSARLWQRSPYAGMMASGYATCPL